MYGWFATAITAAILSGLLWNAERRLDNAQEEINQLGTDLNGAIEANGTVEETLRVCKEVNSSNADQRDEARLAADIALGRVEILEDELEGLIGETFTPTDNDCRTLDDPLPADFTRWLCIDGAQNCGAD